MNNKDSSIVRKLFRLAMLRCFAHKRKTVRSVRIEFAWGVSGGLPDGHPSQLIEFVFGPTPDTKANVMPLRPRFRQQRDSKDKIGDRGSEES